jgi:hypothetical protein
MARRFLVSLIATAVLAAPVASAAPPGAQEYRVTVKCQGPDPVGDLQGNGFVFEFGNGSVIFPFCNGSDRTFSGQLACAQDCSSEEYVMSLVIQGQGSQGACDFFARGHNTFNCPNRSGSNSLQITISISNA